MLLGAFAQTVPDLDFIAHFWLDKTDDIFSHRGITHSIPFVFLVTLLLAEVSKRIFPTRPITRIRWWLLFGINLFVHIFIDSFNAYGTGWFEPFSHARYSFHVIFVADPFFSIWLFIACLFLLFAHTSHYKRKLAWVGGIGCSAFYLIYAIFNKISVDADVRKSLKAQGISTQNYFLTPTPLNCWLWYVVAKDSNGYFIGYRSVFDKQPTVPFNYFPQNDSLLVEAKNPEEVKDLLLFAQGYYTIEKWNDTLVFNVLRFGQMMGGHDRNKKISFHYYLDRPGANELVTQRGRFQNWNRETFQSFIKRIKGENNE